ncbi:MAG: hypothetical protein ACRBN8_45375 [Nannocystales bacterium]
MNAADYRFADHANHWSELRGFVLMLQFNPRTQRTSEALSSVHTLVGLAPVVPGQTGAQDHANLVSARDLLAGAYGFENGW